MAERRGRGINEGTGGFPPGGGRLAGKDGSRHKGESKEEHEKRGTGGEEMQPAGNRDNQEVRNEISALQEDDGETEKGLYEDNGRGLEGDD